MSTARARRAAVLSLRLPSVTVSIVGRGVAIAVAVLATVACGGGEDRPEGSQRPSDLITFDARPDVGGSGAWEVFVADLSSGRVRQLTHQGGYNPTWSSDGSQIAFERVSDGPCNSPACTQIWRMAADGSGEQAVTALDRRAESPAWSPTGEHIAYVQWQPSSTGANLASIYTRTIDGRSVKRLTTEQTFDSDPAWSPDGRRITFVRDDNEEAALYVMNADGTDQHRLEAAKPAAYGPAWSPDGRRLAVWRIHGQYNNAELVAVLNADGSGERTLIRDGGGPVWSPDGRLVAFVPDGLESVISVMRPDGTGRRKLFGGPFSEASNLDWLRRRDA
jgi:Tol biopolymer transport system component